MGKELPMARREKEGRSVLLASTGSGKLSTAPSHRDKGAQEPIPVKTSKGRAAKDSKTKSKDSRKVKRTNASSPKSARRRRDNQDRKSDRGDEGEHKPAGRSASELGIVFPDSYCDELKTVPHYWVGVDRVDGGSLFQCKFCRNYLWLPGYIPSAEYLGKLIRRYGRDEGYCHFLDRHRQAKMLVAKLQDLRRLEMGATNKREFAKLADRIMSDSEYDRKEPQMIELCSHYTTTGYPTFKPRCKVGLRASLKYHSRLCKCPKYIVKEEIENNRKEVTNG